MLGLRMIADITNNIRPLFVPRNKLLIFNYHQVSSVFDPSKHIEGIWTQADYFYEQIHYLKNNYEIVSLDDALHDIESKTLNNTKVALTFDDGDTSIEEFVVPYLKSESIPASFFINTAYLDPKKSCWTDMPLYQSKIQNQITAVDWQAQIAVIRSSMDKSVYSSGVDIIEREMSDISFEYNRYTSTRFLANLDTKLFRIGLHGHDHHRFRHFCYEWQLENLKKNKEILSDFSNYIPVFAIPFGKPMDWNQDTLSACKELQLTPLFANGGYSTNTHPIGNRIPADSRDVAELIKGLSPFISRYKL